jgi:hypothetical protein
MLPFTKKHNWDRCIYCGQQIEADQRCPHDQRCSTSSSPCADQFLARLASHIFNDCPLTAARSRRVSRRSM